MNVPHYYLKECRFGEYAGTRLWIRPDWDNLAQWHQSGLWDGVYSGDNEERILHVPSAIAMRKVQERIRNMFQLR